MIDDEEQHFAPKVDWIDREPWIVREPVLNPKIRVPPDFDISKLSRRRLPSKIILLGKENLEKIRGYKAFVEVDSKAGELIITITGLKKTSMKVYNNLEALSEDEIFGK